MQDWNALTWEKISASFYSVNFMLIYDNYIELSQYSIFLKKIECFLKLEYAKFLINIGNLWFYKLIEYWIINSFKEI